MSSSESSGPPPLTPPSLPNSGAWQPTLLEPVRLDGKIVSGTEGIVLGDVEQEVLKGGRFVVYSYNFSVLVMSFRRSSGIHFLRPGNDGAARALGYTLFSLLFGPWGFPWGLIWTPVSVFTNLAGGKDVTAPLLGAFFGPDRAASVMAARRKPSAGWGLMLLRTLFIAAPLTLIGTIWWDAQASQAEELKLTRSPGYAAFNAADTQAMGSTGSGNTAEARETARQIADGMKHFLDQATTHTGGGTPPSHACGVWYEFRDDHCVVLMRVP
ncbi:MAG: hypothetical protein ACOYMN_14755, partial [Roseimicrobium sp.]